MPEGCAIMDVMNDETRARLQRANRAFEAQREKFETARTELADTIIAARKDGALIEDITALVAYRQTQVNRILKAAGLTTERQRRDEPRTDG